MEQISNTFDLYFESMFSDVSLKTAVRRHSGRFLFLSSMSVEGGQHNSLQASGDTAQSRPPSSSSRSAKTFGGMKGTAKSSLDKPERNILVHELIIK